ncbi:MAG TPA: hypothetical protein EYP90_06915 [Chromatiaceae bacterium]|nr:hypothetical protein [Chromatiaceae bacterium]
MRTLLLLAALLVAMALTGCGRKGPLYLPDDGKPEEQAQSHGSL